MIIDFEQAVQRVGGFGLYQCIICLVLILAFMSKGWIIYGLPYLEKFPEYECQVSGSGQAPE